MQPEPVTAAPDAVTAWQHPQVHLTAATRHRTMPVTYVVLSGDSLSKIAAREYGNPALWPALWWVNKAHVRNPNVIEVGQRLRLSTWHPQAAWLASAASRAVPRADPPAHGAARRALAGGDPNDHQDSCTPHCPWGDGDKDGMDRAHSPFGGGGTVTVTVHSGYQARHARRSYSSGGSVRAGSSFEACVIARESGGNSQVMNSSGHYGLYQFSASTWAAYGGNPGDFGHASAAEQQAVFRTAIAQGGQSNWSPYDGC